MGFQRQTENQEKTQKRKKNVGEVSQKKARNNDEKHDVGGTQHIRFRKKKKKENHDIAESKRVTGGQP